MCICTYAHICTCIDFRLNILALVNFSSAIVSSLNVTTLSSTAVLVSWLPIKSLYADHYLLHYYMKPAKGKRSEPGSTPHEQEMKLPIHASSTTITHLQEGFNYVFRLAVVAKINGHYYRGNTTEVVLSGIYTPKLNQSYMYIFS